jgi:cysteine-rich repeat protein
MRKQEIWVFAIGPQFAMAMILGGCQLPLGIACGNGWCSDGEICSSYNPAHPVCLQSACGNGHLDSSEECDDGNLVDGDGCSSKCKREICGNGITDLAAGEKCDDGNTMDGDGCSAKCQLENCGNGVMDPGEECDDGNLVDGDSCEHDCKLPRCGNGIIDRGEQCDNGARPCGSCNAECVITPDMGATGMLVIADADDYKLGDNVKIADGRHSEVFEFTKTDPISFSAFPIVIKAGESRNDVAVQAAQQISGVLSIDTKVVANVVIMTSNEFGFHDDPISTNITTNNFAVVGMSGGHGGNCSIGDKCTQNADCLPILGCSDGTCK